MMDVGRAGRCVVVASRKGNFNLTHDQLFERSVDHWGGHCCSVLSEKWVGAAVDFLGPG